MAFVRSECKRIKVPFGAYKIAILVGPLMIGSPTLSCFACYPVNQSIEELALTGPSKLATQKRHDELSLTLAFSVGELGLRPFFAAYQKLWPKLKSPTHPMIKA